MNETSPVWYALIDGQQVGPLSESELRDMIEDGQVGRDTLVWSEGMADWQPAKDCAAVADGFRDIPPGPRPGPVGVAPMVDGGPVAPASAGFAGYAGFWKRLAAFLIDWLVTMIGGAMVGFIFGILLTVQGLNDPAVLEGLGNILGIVIGWLYFAVMESSPTQGTLGKMALGIKVTDLQGRPIAFGKATGRHFGKIISGLILLIGFVMVAFTERKQGLHDIMAGCLVMNRETRDVA